MENLEKLEDFMISTQMMDAEYIDLHFIHKDGDKDIGTLLLSGSLCMHDGKTMFTSNDYEYLSSHVGESGSNATIIFNLLSSHLEKAIDFPISSVGSIAVDGGFAIGDYSIAFGQYDRGRLYPDMAFAIGKNSMAFGSLARAIGRNAVCFGSGLASAKYAFSCGGGTATGQCSFALGTSIASGSNAIAIGTSNTASGRGSFVHGSGDYSNYAIGRGSHAEGSGVSAIGVGSHAEGNDCRTVGDYSHAEGRNCLTEGKSAHAEGYNCKAVGDYSHAEGSSTEAHGEGSLACGIYAYTQLSNSTGAPADYTFVWNASRNYYYYALAERSFCILPNAGIQGFFIGADDFVKCVVKAIQLVNSDEQYARSKALLKAALQAILN